MKSIDDFLDELEQERPQDVHDASTPGSLELDEEDHYEILLRTFLLCSDLLEHPLPEPVLQEAKDLHDLLNQVISWDTFH